MRKRLEAMERLGGDVCPGVMLAGQCLAREVGQYLAHAAPLSCGPLPDGVKDVIIDRECGAHASDASTSPPRSPEPLPRLASMARSMFRGAAPRRHPARQA